MSLPHANEVLTFDWIWKLPWGTCCGIEFSSNSNSAMETCLYFQGICPCCWVFVFLSTLFVLSSLITIYLSGFWIAVFNHFYDKHLFTETRMSHTITNIWWSLIGQVHTWLHCPCLCNVGCYSWSPDWIIATPQP